MTDDEIYTGALNGDPTALAEFFGSTREHVERTCSFFLGDEEALSNAMVGTYSRALNVLGKGQKPGLPLKSWLSILATQECFPTLARLRADYDAQSLSLEELAGKITTLVEITSDPKERVNFMIRGDIEDIGDQHRQVLSMSELEGLHFLDLAKRMGCSWTLALTRLIAARSALGKRVKESFGL